MSDRLTYLVFYFIAMAVITLFALFTAPKANAHEAPSGWAYGVECCSSTDCREVPASYVRETPAGYVLTKTGETLSYGDSRVKASKDDGFHLCTLGGKDDGRTICLYVPPRAY